MDTQIRLSAMVSLKLQEKREGRLLDLGPTQPAGAELRITQPAATLGEKGEEDKSRRIDSMRVTGDPVAQEECPLWATGRSIS